MSNIYGRSGLPDWQAGTATVVNGSTSVSFVGATLTSVDPTTGATLWVAGRGDFFTVAGVGAVMIASVTDANDLVLMSPWPYTNQSGVAYSIVRLSFPATGSLAKAVTDLNNMGTDILPDLSRTFDDSTARIKIKNLTGKPTLAVGPTGTADGALLAAIQADKTTGVVSFPQGAAAPADWQKNRIINGGFDIWPEGTSFSLASGLQSYTAAQWLIGNWTTGVNASVSRITHALFSSTYGIAVVATGVAIGGAFGFYQRFEASALADLAGEPCALSFDLIATTSAGTLSCIVGIVTNTAIDNGTFSNNNPQSSVTIQPGVNRVTVSLSAAATANANLGASLVIYFQQAAASANVNIQIGGVQLEKGTTANSFASKPISQEWSDSERYFETSYAPGVAPGTVVASSTGMIVYTATNFAALYVPYKTRKRTNPTVKLYSINTGAVGKFYTNGVGDVSAVTQVSDTVGMFAQVNNVAIATCAQVNFHWTSDARL